MLAHEKLTSENIGSKNIVYKFEKYDQNSPVVSCKAKKKQHAHAQSTQLTGVLFTGTNAVKFASAITEWS